MARALYTLARTVSCALLFCCVVSVWAVTTATSMNGYAEVCPDATFAIAESIPVGMNLTTSLHTPDAWLGIMARATHTLDIAALYMTLTGGATEGQDVLDGIAAAARRGVRVRLAISQPSDAFPDTDLAVLAAAAGPSLSVAYVNMSAIYGSGVLHTKFIIADDNEFYLGSANLDWRSLTQVKELGVVVVGCAALAADLRKVFEGYLYVAEHASLPRTWPSDLETAYDVATPAQLKLNGSGATAFISSAPGELCPRGRTDDLSAIVASIASAKSSISIEVMDYLPTTLYATPRKLWTDIDDALRAAAFERNVTVRLIASQWQYSIPGADAFLRSLDSIDNIQVRLMSVPIIEPYVPFTRVNHAKFMVTDNHAVVCTSNWVGDYFLTTAGVSMTIESPHAVDALAAVFERDWASEYVRPLGAVGRDAN